MTTISTYQAKQFSTHILTWFERHGRHQLPWQNKNAYCVWLSEIMLQQTQVMTVIGYYQRFLNTFPTIESLANATIDDVLAVWAGLGYYARARNLHKTAQILCHEYQGKFPSNMPQMQRLPGIGRSTAAAILTFALHQSHPILDGNVKRVLARHYEIEGWSGTSKTLKMLWSLSEQVTPKSKTAQFNQAMMDMGATVCTRSKPKCGDCCLSKTCLAFKNKSWSIFPNSKPKKKKLVKQTYLVMLQHQGSIYLEKRIASGIWGGLWCLPEFASSALAKDWISQQILDFDSRKAQVYQEELLHRFSHYDLMIHLIVYDSNKIAYQAHDNHAEYVSRLQIRKIGLPTPIKTLLKNHAFLNSSKTIITASE